MVHFYHVDALGAHTNVRNGLLTAGYIGWCRQEVRFLFIPHLSLLISAKIM